MRYEWLTQDQIIELVNPALKSKGYAELGFNGRCECGRPLPTARVLGAFLGSGDLVEVLCFQAYPFLGPMLKIIPELRDSGSTSRGLASVMEEWLMSCGVRGYMAVAASPVVERLCEKFKMKRVLSPVFEYVRTAHNADEKEV